AVKLMAIFWHMLEGQPTAETTMIMPDRSDSREREIVSRQSPAAGFRGRNQRRRSTTLAGLVVAAVCLALAVAIAANYPLAPCILGLVLTLYALALWRWPSLWLAVIPAALPALDFAPWTGWMYLGEPDLLVLVTIGILALRMPPQRTDFLVKGLPAAVLALALVSYLLSVALGLALPGPESGSDHPYLRPDNA